MFKQNNNDNKKDLEDREHLGFVIDKSQLVVLCVTLVVCGHPVVIVVTGIADIKTVWPDCNLSPETRWRSLSVNVPLKVLNILSIAFNTLIVVRERVFGCNYSPAYIALPSTSWQEETGCL